MATCPTCSGEVPGGNRYCGSCGAAARPSAPPTETSPPREHPATTASPDSLDRTRFFPGTLLAGRYRIISLLGCGGMGEVYRADDLKLGQPVALKFLPEGVQRDARRLDRFLDEVKVALKVSHSSVCRVRDIGEIDGQHYLSMEYVDGEDLASLLRRIGRVPEERAVQIARQLCAGLAAAHEQGILHRDLKPANVMIDGRGRAKITDFGLAGLLGSFRGTDVLAGTPAYMAPEQLAGREVSVRSDLYSLGLVLYEMFTGKRPFEARTESVPATLSSHVHGLDPAVERAILRCLEREPADRPASALAVSAALPGGDSLVFASMAGETLSPEMVAEAGREGTLRPAVALMCLVFVLAGVILQAHLVDRIGLLGRVPLDRSPDVLADRARQILERIGQKPAEHGASGFLLYPAQLDYVQREDSSPARWNRLAEERPAAIGFWYRQSPTPLVAADVWGRVSVTDPPLDLAGMVRLHLDSLGMLQSLLLVPTQPAGGDGPSGDPDWTVLFGEAGLRPEDFVESRPRGIPEVYCERRVAWEGRYPGQARPPVRVEACANAGSPISFAVIHPWTPAFRGAPPSSAGEHEPAGATRRRIEAVISGALNVAALVGALILARRNLRLGRGDRKSAFRLATYLVCIEMLYWLFRADHAPDFTQERLLLTRAVGAALYDGGRLWLMYIALEPFVRRRWPESIVSWSRLLAGRFRNPLVGRHLLLGAVIGVASGLISRLRDLMPGWLAAQPIRPVLVNPALLEGFRGVTAELLDTLGGLVVGPTFFLFLLVLFRVILRSMWFAIVVLVAIMSLAGNLGGEHFVPSFLLSAVLWALGVLIVVRFGLVGALTGYFFVSLGATFPLTLDLSAWYAGSSLAGLAIAAALAFVAFRISLGGRSLLRGVPQS